MSDKVVRSIWVFIGENSIDTLYQKKGGEKCHRVNNTNQAKLYL